MASNTRQSHLSVRQQLDLALHDELRESEVVVWSGMKLARIEPKGFGIYLFAIPWTAFALFWTSLAFLFTRGDDGVMGWAFPLFGTPFILIGIGMLASPFLPYFQRGRILFAITNQRVLQLSLGSDLTVTSVPASRVGDITRMQSPDGSGSVELTLTASVTSFHGRKIKSMIIGRVDDIRGAYEAVLELSQRD